MRKIIYIVIIGILLLQNVFAAEIIIPDKNQVILTKGSKYFHHKVGWIPTKEDTSKALNAIAKFLQNSEEHENYNEYKQSQIKLIREQFLMYHVQFIGIIIDGKKIIHCNFFPNDESSPYWKDSYVFVFDGGCSYWRIDYGIDAGKCSNFESNGPG